MRLIHRATICLIFLVCVAVVGVGNAHAQQSSGKLCVLKYEDTNYNGQKDAGEGPLEGMGFTIQGTGGYLAGGYTDRNGLYCVTLPTGYYTVSEPPNWWGSLPPGWENSDPGVVSLGWTPYKNNQKVEAGKTTTVLFGNYRKPASICVDKYLDINGDGTWISATPEPRLPGWPILIQDSSGHAVASGVTDSAGLFCKVLPAGTYTVSEGTLPGGWVNTEPGGSAPYKTTVTIPFGAYLHYGNRPTGTGTGNPIPVDPCCPPWSQRSLEAMMSYVPVGGPGAPFYEKFIPAAGFNGQMQAYLNYLNAMDPSITSIAIEFQLLDATGLIEAQTVQWTVGGSAPAANLFQSFLFVNHTYEIRTKVSLNAGKTFFPDKCAKASIKVRKLHGLQAQPGPGGRESLQIERPDGTVRDQAVESLGAR